MSQGRSEDRLCDPRRHRDSGRFSFPDFYQREKPRLMRFFARQLGNQADADELAQESFARFVKVAPVHALASPQAYLTRIATNLLRDFVSRGATLLAQKSTPLDDTYTLVAQIDTHRALASREELAHWQSVLQQLSPETLDIFVANRIADKSYREIAQERNVPLWTVQEHMKKALRLLAAHRETDSD
ncbi:MAG: RNA polymerase sigma factor [Pseudomonadota bacterium]